MNAAMARSAAKSYIAKLQRDHDVEYKATKDRETRQANELWKKRGSALINLIDGYIEKASAKGDHGTYEPTDVNPNGDEIIYLKKSDLPIHEPLMEYFRGQGFDVEEYQYGGMKITW